MGPTPGSPGARVRPELPVHRLAALVVRDLDVRGDPERAAAPVHGARFTMQEGTLALLTPASRGHTVVLCLAGHLDPATGTIETENGTRREPVRDTAWRLVVNREPADSESRAETVVEDAGPAARRAALRLGLGPVLGRTVAELGSLHRTLLGLAEAMGDGPDVVALVDPGAVLDDGEVVVVLDALRELVDVEGRTVIVTSDLDAIPVEVRSLLDQIVEL